MNDALLLLIQFGIPVFLLCLALIVGGAVERRHFKDLEAREGKTEAMLVTQLKSFPQAEVGEQPPQLIVAEVVISSDYLKSFLGVIRSLFGGEIRSFQTLLERGRREALLQLKESALSQGYNAICNVRIETADIAGRGQRNKNKVIMAPMLASATAYTSTHR